MTDPGGTATVTDLAPVFSAFRAHLAGAAPTCAALLCEAIDALPSTTTAHLATHVPGCRFLAQALGQAGWPFSADMSDRLAWRRPGFGTLPQVLSDRMAVTELLGPTGMIRHDAVSLGVILVGPDVDYPSHSHAAEELYIPLCGSLDWTIDGLDIGAVTPGRIVHHLPWQPHATLNRSDPALLFWGWTGDIRASTYAINAAAVPAAAP